MNYPRKKGLRWWALVEPFETEYLVTRMVQHNNWMRPLIGIVSILLWVAAGIATMTFTKEFQTREYFSGALATQIILGVAYFSTFITGKFRVILMYITPIYFWSFLALYLGYMVAPFHGVSQLMTHGMAVWVIFLIYTVERVNPHVAIVSGLGATLLYGTFRWQLGLQGEDIGAQIILHLVVANLSGIVVSYIWAINDRKQFFLSHRLDAEKNASEVILARAFPVKIAQQLSSSRDVIADFHPDVTILFADLVNFTPLALELQATHLVSMLHELFSQFDQLADEFEIEKIKTVGDSYMAVCGCPEADHLHATKIALFSFAIVEQVAKFREKSGYDLHLRVGMHSGPVVAGVICDKRISYDIWGNTVNIASRMESTGATDQIQVSEATWELLRRDFVFSEGRTIHVKGKGEMRTYDLLSTKEKSIASELQILKQAS
jgi:class 3 adenylate cyclase